jgi:ribosomal protein L7/L12
VSNRTEAERLRVIIQTLAYAEPDMKLSEAVPAIWEIEKQTAKLELEQRGALSMNPDGTYTLADNNPVTIAAWIDTQPDIIALMPHKKINAIKEVRGRLLDPERMHTSSPAGDKWHVGLKDAKDAVEAWAAGIHLR